MERTFKVSWIQDTGLIAATLLNERALKSESNGRSPVRKADYTDISNNVCGVKAFFERPDVIASTSRSRWTDEGGA